MNEYKKLLDYIPLYAIFLMITVIFICVGLILSQYIIMLISLLPLLVFIILLLYFSKKNPRRKKKINYV